MSTGATIAFRWVAPRATLRHGLAHLSIAVVAIVLAYLDGTRESPALPTATFALSLVVFGPLALFHGSRLLFDSGAVPRFWVRREGDDFVVWSVWSLVWRGRRVRASTEKPAEIVVRTSSMMVLPGSLAGGWLLIRDDRVRVALTIHAPDVPAALEDLAAKVIATGLPLKDIIREVQ